MAPDGTATGRSSADAWITAALIAGGTWDEAAALAGVSRRTVARRVADRGFRAQLDQLRRDALARAADNLAGSVLLAVETLRGLLGEDQTAPIRLGAGRVLLSEAARYQEATSVAARLEAVEGALRMRPPA